MLVVCSKAWGGKKNFPDWSSENSPSLPLSSASERDLSGHLPWWTQHLCRHQYGNNNQDSNLPPLDHKLIISVGEREQFGPTWDYAIRNSLEGFMFSSEAATGMKSREMRKTDKGQCSAESHIFASETFRMQGVTGPCGMWLPRTGCFPFLLRDVSILRWSEPPGNVIVLTGVPERKKKKN